MSASVLDSFKTKELGKGSKDNDLYKHLGELFDSLIMNHQEDGLKKLEKISRITKKSSLPITDPVPSQQLSEIIPKPKDGDWYLKAKAIAQVRWEE